MTARQFFLPGLTGLPSWLSGLPAWPTCLACLPAFLACLFACLSSWPACPASIACLLELLALPPCLAFLHYLACLAMPCLPFPAYLACLALPALPSPSCPCLPARLPTCCLPMKSKFSNHNLIVA
jgi:hypothetical protein